MPAARGVKRTASKSSASTASAGPKNKKKRNVVQLEVPTLPKIRGRVLTCGQGDVGQLGLGEDVMETTKFKQVTGLGDKIVDACAGGMHTIALDSDGKVWTFGCNDEGALGRTTSEDSEEGQPAPVTLPGKAVKISAGDSHSAALLENGDVYAWGSFRDSHGAMGLVVRGREGKPCLTPVQVDVNEPCAGIASGGDHLVLLTVSGSVYTMGCGEQGQLGRLSQRSASRDTRQGFSALLAPAKVTLKAGASRVWAGYHGTFALDANMDKMFAWGLNNYGQLGITGEKRKTALYTPIECDAFSSVNESGWKQVAVGQHHSLALAQDGPVYAVGRCEYGRLGLGDRTGDAEGLEVVPKLQGKKCISIAAGTSNSFAVTDSGEVFGWGMGSEGQLGTGRSHDAAAPTPAADLPAALIARAVAAGGQHTVLLTEDPNSKREPTPPPEKETAEQTEESAEEEAPPPEKKPKGRQTKRQKKQEQEDEVSSTSSAQPSDVTDENVPQKVNGDDKKETAMDVDETDNKPTKTEETDSKSNDNKEKMDTDTSSQDTAASLDSQDVDMKEPGNSDKPETKSDQPETKDNNSDKQETNSDQPETKVDKQETNSEKSETVDKQDTNSEKSDSKVEKSENSDKSETKSEVNGAPEVVEAKTVEAIAEKPLTTTA